ncbi:MAG: class I SAM-dependent methyltransferase [Pseudomonadota bacterium]
MAEHRNHLSRVYGLDTQEETDAFYSDWAATYDAEVIANGYKTPERLSKALVEFAAKNQKILDIGCGTGFSGEHLAAQGFSNIHGTDPNDEMLEVARQRSVYTSVWKTDLSDPLTFEIGAYHVITAIGVISTGAAPPETLEAVLHKLKPGGLLAFSFNDHALDEPAFPAARDDVLAKGLATERYRNYGPHLTGQNLNSDIYIFERL